MEAERFLEQDGLLNERLTNLIEEGAHFEGKLSFEGLGCINGSFIGEIFTRDRLIIGETGTVKASVEADIVVIRGRLEGHIFARRRVVMIPPAVFKGTVTAPSLRIDEGVIFEGASFQPQR
jgi:cytoskeletal protein CcmA (bactofilin family)